MGPMHELERTRLASQFGPWRSPLSLARLNGLMRRLHVVCAVFVVVCAAPVACGGSEGIDPSAIPDSTTQRALMTRWNAAADAAGYSNDFSWPSFDQFPHPTFKGGSEEAYQQFAAVLLLFLQSADNFDFLAQHHLFQAPVRNILVTGQIGIDTTFQQLAMDFSSSTGFGNIPEATRQALKSFVARMK